MVSVLWDHGWLEKAPACQFVPSSSKTSLTPTGCVRLYPYLRLSREALGRGITPAAGSLAYLSWFEGSCPHPSRPSSFPAGHQFLDDLRCCPQAVCRRWGREARCLGVAIRPAQAWRAPDDLNVLSCHWQFKTLQGVSQQGQVRTGTDNLGVQVAHVGEHTRLGAAFGTRVLRWGSSGGSPAGCLPGGSMAGSKCLCFGGLFLGVSGGPSPGGGF